MTTTCPLCRSNETTPTVRRTKVPVLQNRVYKTREEAMQSPSGVFVLHTCAACGFSFNGAFDSRLVVYDESYDNDVPSAAFERYYVDLASRLIERFGLSSGTVYDIGCGKGTFLRTLCRLAPGIHGIGVDPSCRPETAGNITLVKDVFRPEIVGPDPTLVLLRHVLEHIEQPVALLAGIARAAPKAPLFVEVPELDWIFENGTFWDFCYEHCNYFTPGSLACAMRRAGYRVQEQLSLFSGQFQGIVGEPDPAVTLDAPEPNACAVDRAAAYASTEADRMRAAHQLVEAAQGGAVLWGMATKGVMFASLTTAPLAGGVDVNPRKQHRFAPGSGLRINPPDWLVALEGTPTIFIMNGNYAHEIRQNVAALDVKARFVEL